MYGVEIWAKLPLGLADVLCTPCTSVDRVATKDVRGLVAAEAVRVVCRVPQRAQLSPCGRGQREDPSIREVAPRRRLSAACNVHRVAFGDQSRMTPRGVVADADGSFSG